MIGDSRETDSLSRFREILCIQRQREKKIGEKVIQCLRRREFPTPDDVRNDINFHIGVGEQRQHILRHHAYWKERQLRLGLESLIRAAHQAYVDICCHDAALGSLARGRDFEDHVDHTVGYAAQKDMVAYCSLVVGVLDTLRRIKNLRPDIKVNIQSISDECFNHDVTIFIKDMRKNLVHGSVVIPKWQITSDFQNLSGSMTYETRELLSFGEWTCGSKKYVSSGNDRTINLSGVVGAHYKLLEDFDRKIQDLFARNVTDAERDFFEIEDSYKRYTRGQWTKIVIGQTGKDKDPYKYLHQFFDPETVREILRRPRHSKEQVDFIIALKAAELDCDDDLRRALYEKFGVTDDSST